MSLFTTCRRGAQVSSLSGLLLALAIAAGCGPKPAPPKPTPPKTATNAPPATNSVTDTQTNIINPYASYFEDLPPPQARDPFFPDRLKPPKSTVVAPTSATPIAPVEPGTNLVLRSILGRQAVINNAIFKANEEQKVRVPDECHVPEHQAAIGKEPQVYVTANHLLARCIEVGTDYVIIQVEGEAEPRKIMMEHRQH